MGLWPIWCSDSVLRRPPGARPQLIWNIEKLSCTWLTADCSQPRSSFTVHISSFFHTSPFDPRSFWSIALLDRRRRRLLSAFGCDTSIRCCADPHSHLVYHLTSVFVDRSYILTDTFLTRTGVQGNKNGYANSCSASNGWIDEVRFFWVAALYDVLEIFLYFLPRGKRYFRPHSSPLRQVCAFLLAAFMFVLLVIIMFSVLLFGSDC